MYARDIHSMDLAVRQTELCRAPPCCCACCVCAAQPARLLARVKTLFRHYSIAASICGNYVAATGNSGLLSLFRVQRSNPNATPSDKTPATAAAAAGSSSSTAAAPQGVQGPQAQQEPGGVPLSSAAYEADAVEGGEGDGEGGEGGQEAQLEWQLVHVATLLCKNGPETMVNSVRFGHFGGRLRMLVAHQVRKGGGVRRSRAGQDGAGALLSTLCFLVC